MKFAQNVTKAEQLFYECSRMVLHVQEDHCFSSVHLCYDIIHVQSELPLIDPQYLIVSSNKLTRMLLPYQSLSLYMQV